jgi:putative transcriptional regulator
MKNDEFKDFNFSEALKHSMEQALAHKNGDSSRVRIVVREKRTPRYSGEDVKRIRTKLGLSQNGMALALGVSKRTVEAWESGRISPRKASEKLLYLIENNDGIIDQLIMI